MVCQYSFVAVNPFCVHIGHAKWLPACGGAGKSAIRYRRTQCNADNVQNGQTLQPSGRHLTLRASCCGGRPSVFCFILQASLWRKITRSSSGRYCRMQHSSILMTKPDHTAMKKILLTAATLVALAAPAMALNRDKAAELDVGRTLRFSTPRPITVGCTHLDDAWRVARFVQKKQWYALQDFVDWFSDTESERTCITLNASPDNSWTVVKSGPVGGPYRGRWTCLLAERDYHYLSEKNVPVPLPCLWIYIW